MTSIAGKSIAGALPSQGEHRRRPGFALHCFAGALAVPFGALPRFAASLRRIALQYPCFAVPGVASALLYVAALCRGQDLRNYARQCHSIVVPGNTRGLSCDASRCPCRARQCTASHRPACVMLCHAPRCRSLETAAQCQCTAMSSNAMPVQVRRLCLATQCRCGSFSLFLILRTGSGLYWIPPIRGGPPIPPPLWGYPYILQQTSVFPGSYKDVRTFGLYRDRRIYTSTGSQGDDMFVHPCTNLWFAGGCTTP